MTVCHYTSVQLNLYTYIFKRHIKGCCGIFVGTGNICRSPIAEAVFRKMATDTGVVDKVSTPCKTIKTVFCTFLLKLQVIIKKVFEDRRHLSSICSHAGLTLYQTDGILKTRISV